jgi:hypothetical protein
MKLVTIKVYINDQRVRVSEKNLLHFKQESKMALIKTVPESILKKRKQNELVIKERLAKKAALKKVC